MLHADVTQQHDPSPNHQPQLPPRLRL
jgi:hypothetical protein